MTLRFYVQLDGAVNPLTARKAIRDMQRALGAGQPKVDLDRGRTLTRLHVSMVGKDHFREVTNLFGQLETQFVPAPTPEAVVAALGAALRAGGVRVGLRVQSYTPGTPGATQGVDWARVGGRDVRVRQLPGGDQTPTNKGAQGLTRSAQRLARTSAPSR